MAEAAAEAAELLVFGMIGRKTCLLPKKLDCESVGHDHDHHWYVEGDQRAEDEEGAVVDHARVRLGHDILVVDDACGPIAD